MRLFGTGVLFTVQVAFKQAVPSWGRWRAALSRISLVGSIAVLAANAHAVVSDGDVDGDDLLAVQIFFGAFGDDPGVPAADCDGDGDVDGDDLIFVQTSFGAVAPTSVGEVLSPLLLGDPDDNSGGDIDGDDLIAVMTNFGSTNPPPGDYDSDGDVDGDDLIYVQTSFGRVAPASAVPEPTAATLLLLAACLAPRRTRSTHTLC